VGLAYVKSRIVDDAESRLALHARFLESQKYAQVDPWTERARGKDAEEFATLGSGEGIDAEPSAETAP
jgi:nitrite reductase (NADH) large subunit